jgi:hypothetical protein
VTTWADQAADLIEQGVSTARDRAVEPIRSVARAIVFGLLAASFIVVAALMAAIGAFRLAVNYLPVDNATAVWIVDLILGLVFVTAGAVAWTRRTPSRETA